MTGSLKSGCGQGCSLLEALGDNSGCLWPSFWQLQAFLGLLGLRLHHPGLCLSARAFSLCLSGLRTPSSSPFGWRVTPNPQRSPLKAIILITSAKNSFQGQTDKFWGSGRGPLRIPSLRYGAAQSSGRRSCPVATCVLQAESCRAECGPVPGAPAPVFPPGTPWVLPRHRKRILIPPKCSKRDRQGLFEWIVEHISPGPGRPRDRFGLNLRRLVLTVRGCRDGMAGVCQAWSQRQLAETGPGDLSSSPWLWSGADRGPPCSPMHPGPRLLFWKVGPPLPHFHLSSPCPGPRGTSFSQRD